MHNLLKIIILVILTTNVNALFLTTTLPEHNSFGIGKQAEYVINVESGLGEDAEITIEIKGDQQITQQITAEPNTFTLSPRQQGEIQIKINYNTEIPKAVYPVNFHIKATPKQQQGTQIQLAIQKTMYVINPQVPASPYLEIINSPSYPQNEDPIFHATIINGGRQELDHSKIKTIIYYDNKEVDKIEQEIPILKYAQKYQTEIIWTSKLSKKPGKYTAEITAENYGNTYRVMKEFTIGEPTIGIGKIPILSALYNEEVDFDLPISFENWNEQLTGFIILTLYDQQSTHIAFDSKADNIQLNQGINIINFKGSYTPIRSGDHQLAIAIYSHNPTIRTETTTNLDLIGEPQKDSQVTFKKSTQQPRIRHELNNPIMINNKQINPYRLFIAGIFLGLTLSLFIFALTQAFKNDK